MMKDKDKKPTVFREDGVYNVDFSELEELKKKNLQEGKLKQQNLTGEQRKFLVDYWYFLTPSQRKEIIAELFPGKSYGAVVKRIEGMRNAGIQFKRP